MPPRGDLSWQLAGIASLGMLSFEAVRPGATWISTGLWCCLQNQNFQKCRLRAFCGQMPPSSMANRYR